MRLSRVSGTFALLAHSILGIAVLNGCVAAPWKKSGPLLAKYKAATCLPLTISPAMPRKTRSWQAEVTIANGSRIVVEAAAIPGGYVTVRYLDTSEKVIAANAGDYVYPYDIRINRQTDRLYVVASGLAGGIWQRTVLFEYDLRARRQTAKRGVNDKDLPEGCPAPASSNK